MEREGGREFVVERVTEARAEEMLIIRGIEESLRRERRAVVRAAMEEMFVEKVVS